MATNSRPKASVEDIEDFLYELGPVDKDDVISFRGIDFEIIRSLPGRTPKTLELVFTHPGSKHALNHFKGGIFKEVKGNFSGFVSGSNKYKGFEAIKWDGGRSILYLSPDEDEDAGKGTVPPQVHERGTALVFTRALHSKKPFKSEDDLQNDEKLTKDLKKVFGTKWEHRRKDWTHSFYEQQQAALKEYSNPAWSEFEYGNKSFTQFFADHIGKLHRDLDPKVPVQRYERWNPSDIWAVKTGRMDEIKKQLKKQISPQTVLTELNSILIGLMEKNELVGISLKKIDKKQGGNIKLYNVDTSAALKALDSYANLEEFDMKDIHFEPDNILLAKNVTSYVRIGKGDKYTVSITNAGNNISFTAQIKGTAAQGGNAPVELVHKLLKSKEFKKNHNSYPKDPDAFLKQGTYYKKIYKEVAKYASSASQKMKFEDWQQKIVSVYGGRKGERDAKVMLMELTFWYDALTKFAKNSEFWTDLLYYGMKVTSRGAFAPHAKIS